MLSVLHIENLAVIESSDITFDSSLNLLTGETGAGKSIIIDALGAILGWRTSRDVIRSGCKKAFVSAVFCNLHNDITNWLIENDFFSSSELNDEELLVSREIFEDGRNVCKVGGKPITVAKLKELGSKLVGIHGQHDNHALLDETSHLQFLDAFSGINISIYSDIYKQWLKCSKEITSLQTNEADKQSRIEMLEFRLDELESHELIKGEETELVNIKNQIKHAEKITKSVANTHVYLYGDDDSDGAISLLECAIENISEASNYDESYSEVVNVLSDILENLKDASAEISLPDIEREDTDSIESRLYLFSKLKSKYKMTIDEIVDNIAVWRVELDSLRYSDERLEKLVETEIKLRNSLDIQAKKLSIQRKTSADELIQRLQDELKSLDMGKVKFSTEFSDVEPNSNGIDNVLFLIATNTGESLKHLSKIASGGELARIMLAFKNILAESDSVATMVFDEVDTGVSGRAAQKVAQKLCNVSRKKQVLCVTHLPQIAAMADTHFKIEKNVIGDRTITTVDPLTIDGRIDEIARIISGQEVTQITRQSAAELINQAEKYRTTL